MPTPDVYAVHHALPCSQPHTPNEVRIIGQLRRTHNIWHPVKPLNTEHLGDMESVLYSKASLLFVGKTIDCYYASIRFREVFYTQRVVSLCVYSPHL